MTAPVVLTQIFLALIQGVAWIILFVGILQNATYLLQTVMAFLALRRLPPRRELPLITGSIDRSAVIPVSVLVPAHNEAAVIVDSARALLHLDYPKFEVIVINDGSHDDTMLRLTEEFGLTASDRVFEAGLSHAQIHGVFESERYSNLVVVDKENGGKSDSLNAGINVSRYPLFCAIDADSLLEADALGRAVQPFAVDPERTVVTGGTIRIANGCTFRDGKIHTVRTPDETLALLQWVEYTRAFLMGRLGWSEMDAMLLVSGAFGVFKRSVVVQAGGYDTKTVGEDYELTVRIHKFLRDAGAHYDIVFVPEPVCWTQAPIKLSNLARQRRRWQRGALETFFKHWRMVFNPTYGRVGIIAFGNSFLVDVIGPPLEILGYFLVPLLAIVGILSVEFLLAYTAVTFLFGVFISVSSLVLAEMEIKRLKSTGDLLRTFICAILENFGYRQLTTFWRFLGWLDYLRGTQGWGAQQRYVFRKA